MRSLLGRPAVALSPLRALLAEAESTSAPPAEPEAAPPTEPEAILEARALSAVALGTGTASLAILRPFC